MNRMKRALFSCGVVVVSVAGCGGLDIDALGPVELAATDPALLESARAVVFTWSSTTDCQGLLDASAADIDAIVAKEVDPSVQRIPMLRGQVDPDRGTPNFVDGSATHTFGEVPSNVPVALLAIAAEQDPGQGFQLKDLEGTMFAFACRDLTLAPGKRVEVPLVLAPIGLR